MSDSTKHTPGEWSIKFSTNIVSENGRLVANCGGHQSSENDENPENEANAARIVSMNKSHDSLVEAVRIAYQLAGIASDWNLDEVEIDGRMRPIHKLEALFRKTYRKATGENPQ